MRPNVGHNLRRDHQLVTSTHSSGSSSSRSSRSHAHISTLLIFSVTTVLSRL
ncbi:hypothetical protein CY34DRAFT_253468 [Suillus luteus UH-Slu-Lm8-n1]|uniref:Uncharacterized protein n=1 Tax=Suillus luteus UH-Slu-Lm8-n1 TaxID=930992 RepID=A0A0D0AI28_9AGAM|nr:hypothetical protein CY34DRAFT_253468 [Suillus luteus UH-Slu-Lm8-n1]